MDAFRWNVEYDVISRRKSYAAMLHPYLYSPSIFDPIHGVSWKESHENHLVPNPQKGINSGRKYGQPRARAFRIRRYSAVCPNTTLSFLFVCSGLRFFQPKQFEATSARKSAYSMNFRQVDLYLTSATSVQADIERCLHRTLIQAALKPY